FFSQAVIGHLARIEKTHDIRCRVIEPEQFDHIMAVCACKCIGLGPFANKCITLLQKGMRDQIGSGFPLRLVGKIEMELRNAKTACHFFCKNGQRKHQCDKEAEEKSFSHIKKDTLRIKKIG